MIWKVIATIFLIILLIMFSFIFVFRVYYIEPVQLEVNYLEAKMASIDYGDVPVFAEDMRFNHNLISYSIEDGCDSLRRKEMVAAFNIFSDNVKSISFFEVKKGADIKVGCSNEFIELGNDLFAAGEGGPSRIINTSGFKVVEEGRVILYNGMYCNYPIVALHELCHVFGFDHSPDPENIMYNTSSCNQRMSKDMIDLMKKLYSIEPLGDAKIGDVNGVLYGTYLNFNISILNEGLVDINDIDLAILVDGDVENIVDLGDIDVGYGRTLRVENMKIGRGVEEIEFIVDYNDSARELDEENNIAILKI